MQKKSKLWISIRRLTCLTCLLFTTDLFAENKKQPLPNPQPKQSTTPMSSAAPVVPLPTPKAATSAASPSSNTLPTPSPEVSPLPVATSLLPASDELNNDDKDSDDEDKDLFPEPPPNTDLQLFPYLQRAARVTQKERTVSGISLLVAGAVTTTLPFIVASSDSPIRTPLTYLFLPLGGVTIVYGGYLLVTNSTFRSMELRSMELAGKKPKNIDPKSNEMKQYLLRLEANAREQFLFRSDRTRFWRFFWGGLQTAGAVALVGYSPNPTGISAGVFLISLAAYQFFYERAEERLGNDVRGLTAGVIIERSSNNVSRSREGALALQWKF